MKKLLLTLAAVVGMLGAGSGNAWADTEQTLVISAGSDFTLGCKDATVYGTTKNQYSGNTGTNAEGFSVAITGRTDKALSSGNAISIEGASYTSIKLSNGAENTIYLPTGVTVQSLKLYSYVNYNYNDSKNNGKWGRTSYWSSVNGTNYSAESADTLSCWMNSKSTYTAEDFDCREFTFTNGVTDSIKFKNTGEQICFVIVLSYTTSKASKPTVTSPVFSFAKRGYLVTLTAQNTAETVKYTLNSGTETTYNGAITVTNGDKLTYWAEAEGLDKSEEGTLEVSGLTTYDSNKAFVAWAYQNAYKNIITYTTDSDPLYKAMSEVYNIVPVAGAESDAPATLCPTLEYADLLVISEAMKSNKTFSNGLTAYVGKLPVLNMKAFNYGKSAWKSWGSGSNPSPAAASISPSDGNYELFKGLTVENGEILLFDGTLADDSKANRVQAVSLKDGGLTNPVTLAKTGASVAIHTADLDKGYIFIGISVDDITNVNANAQQLVKNAAALLLADKSVASAAEATDLGTASFSSMDYATFYSETAAIIPEGVTAYTGVLNSNKTALTLEELTGYIPAKTAVVLEGTKGTPATLKSTIYTIAEVSENSLKGSATDLATPSNVDVYTLSIADEKVAFRKFVGDNLSAGKAYLEVEAGQGAPMIRFNGEYTDEPGNVTGISTVAIESNAPQVIYDLNGRRVKSIAAPGLYIVNGKKVAIQ